jgi:plastocyanin
VAGDMFYEPTQLSAPAGTVEITLVNEGAAQHDLVIEELGDLELIPLVDPGDTVTGSVDLEPGTYTFYCSVPGHRAAGMEGTLTVTD